MVKDLIVADLKKILQNLDLSRVEPLVEHPNEELHGDYSTNIAMQIARQLSENPMELAEKIKDNYEALEKSYIEKIEVAKPGFINFWLSKSALVSELQLLLKEKENYGSLKIGKGRKVQVEFISANPTGPLHMGNVRGGPLGDVLANVLQMAGFEVEREFYVNDVGGQVDIFGKTLLAIAPPKHKVITRGTLQYQGEFWNKLAERVKEEAEKQISDRSSSPSYDSLVQLYRRLGVELVIKEMQKDTTDLGIIFDHWTYESEIVKKATQPIVEEIKKKGFTKEKNGALWFAPSDEFLKDRECVLIRSDGTPTYFANDIAYHWDKFIKRKYGLVINVWGANHHGHVSRMKAAVKSLGINPERLQIILYQWVSLKKEGKLIPMSKRKGEFVTAREVLGEIGRDALRFMLLTSGPNNRLELNLDLAKKKVAENPVFYVQYAHARICSIFKKAPHNLKVDPDLTLLVHPAEIRLSKHLIYLPELVEEIVRTYSAHQLTAYSIKLADLFHKFYEECRVISSDLKLSGARLGLILATQIILQNTLFLLGINAPEKM